MQDHSHVRDGLVQQRDQRHAQEPELERDEGDVLTLRVLDATAVSVRDR